MPACENWAKNQHKYIPVHTGWHSVNHSSVTVTYTSHTHYQKKECQLLKPNLLPSDTFAFPSVPQSWHLALLFGQSGSLFCSISSAPSPFLLLLRCIILASSVLVLLSVLLCWFFPSFFLLLYLYSSLCFASSLLLYLFYLSVPPFLFRSICLDPSHWPPSVASSVFFYPFQNFGFRVSSRFFSFCHVWSSCLLHSVILTGSASTTTASVGGKTSPTRSCIVCGRLGHDRSSAISKLALLEIFELSLWRAINWCAVASAARVSSLFVLENADFFTLARTQLRGQL